jgi:hypothetical protein
MTKGHEALGTEVTSAEGMTEGHEALGTEVTSAEGMTEGHEALRTQWLFNITSNVQCRSK